MHAGSDAAKSIIREQPSQKVVAAEVLIIGFGLSVIPLLRELDRDGIDYVIISRGESIWNRLERHGRLDFDMVSSLHSSVYSFELVNRDTADRYLTSKEFSDFIKGYLSKYRSKVTDDLVTLVENNATNSVVHTQSGAVFQVKHLVVATAFKRRMNHLLNEFDYASAKGKTVVISGMGDSVNLMISKLAPYGNRVILVTNGFLLLDKLAFSGSTSYTLDQLEYHNMRRLSYLLYRKTITTGFEFVLLFRRILELLSLDHFYVRHPLAIRRFYSKIGLRNIPHSPFPNGVVAIKYWPIDSYQKLFDNENLKQSIRDGYLLNDIAFFLEQGMVELWPKQKTTIDREQSSIRWDGVTVRYDCIVDPDYEVPNLPEIVVDSDGSDRRKFEYAYRNCFMGIVPKELSNVYFIGFTRPTTGGLNNIIEMQGLFVHKMIAESGFRRDIRGNIGKRLQKYNDYYGIIDTKGRNDHLVHYGFYTDDLARLMKIDQRISQCRSIRDVLIHYVFPNAAYKYRQSGPYKVDGVQEMVHQIYKDHNGFSAVIHYLLTYALLQLTAYAAVATAYFQQKISGLIAVILAMLVLLNPASSFVASLAAPCNAYLNVVMVGGLVLTVYYASSWVPIAAILAVVALTYALRKAGLTRPPFFDLKSKRHPKFVDFFRRYCSAFREVYSEAGATTQAASGSSQTYLAGTASPQDQMRTAGD